MNLAELLEPWVNPAAVPAALNIEGIHQDSREIKPGFLFVAYPGQKNDGRHYIQQAYQQGAIAVLYEPEPSFIFSEIKDFPVIPLPGLVHKLPEIASRFYQYPSQGLKIKGITGTNGKTTIAYLLAQAHSLLGAKAAYIGTLGQGEVSALSTLANTTPDALTLQGLLYKFKQQHYDHICMEVSSHALHQRRVAEVAFEQAIYTNLTHDHLDYHGNMQDYAQAKAALFAYHSLKYAIINIDDSYASLMSSQVPPHCKVFTYSLSKAADIQGTEFNLNLAGSSVTIHSPWGKQDLFTKAFGLFNLYNILAIFSSLMASGYGLSEVTKIISQLQPAPGRLEVLHENPYIIVDYAHTPDALENVLKSLKPLKSNSGNVWLIFGCGGDRDKAKRPLMGQIATKFADKLIITNDNPRHEDPEQIIQDIRRGIPSSQFFEVILDREQAIKRAIECAEVNDIILIAGKGHENYQQVGDVYYPFSDRDVVQQLV